MPLTPSTRLGAYEITAPIGEGGMGQVYLATDSRLKRQVAIKVLAPSLLPDAERLARLQREAEVLAALNHPHIAAIYGLEEADGVKALVMEFVPGEDLAQRIARGAIPLDEVLPIARQIAEALDAAHEQGVVHRDLKPANIKIRNDGTVKVLDFGLAKMMDPTGLSSGASLSPTLTSPVGTRIGTILGTPAYMSPEQARGLAIDKRSDIWAFGCVLFEMLSGRRAFEAATITDTLARILDAEPDWTALPAKVPASIRRLLERCLRKDPKRRLHDIADALIELEDGRSVDGGDGTATVARQSSRAAPWLAWVTAIAGLVIGTGGAAGFFGLRARSAADPAPLQRFQEPFWGQLSGISQMFSLSPDSRHLLLARQGDDGIATIVVRSIDDPAPRRLLGADGFVTSAIWSPRSDAVAFSGTGSLKRVTLTGGVAQTVCDVPGIAVGGSWNRDDVILVGSPRGPLLRCPASGGKAAPVTKTTDPSEMHLTPSFLSDGRHFIYLRINRADPARSGVYTGDLNGSSPAGEKPLLATGFNAIYVPESDAGGSAIVFLRDRGLFAQRFDEQRLEPRGAAVLLADSVKSFLDYAFFSASPRLLAYRAPDPLYQLTWFDRRGDEVRRVGAPEPVAGLALSPSGDRALVARHVPQNVADQDIWLVNLAQDANPEKLTFAAALEDWPAWLTNDRFAYGAGGGERNIYEQNVASREHRVWFQAGGQSGVTVAAEGRVAVFVGMSNQAQGVDLWVRTENGPPNGEPLMPREGNQVGPQLSVDGQQLAYLSNENGRFEVFVAAFRHDTSTGKATVSDIVPVSDGGGFAPRWSGDGKELLYLKADGSVMSVEMKTAARPTPGPRKRLFIAPLGVFPEWGVTRDGTKLLFAVPTGPPPLLQIIQNWQVLLPN